MAISDKSRFKKALGSCGFAKMIKFDKRYRKSGNSVQEWTAGIQAQSGFGLQMDNTSEHVVRMVVVVAVVCNIKYLKRRQRTEGYLSIWLNQVAGILANCQPVMSSN